MRSEFPAVGEWRERFVGRSVMQCRVGVAHNFRVPWRGRVTATITSSLVAAQTVVSFFSPLLFLLSPFFAALSRKSRRKIHEAASATFPAPLRLLSGSHFLYVRVARGTMRRPADYVPLPVPNTALLPLHISWRTVARVAPLKLSTARAYLEVASLFFPNPFTKPWKMELYPASNTWRFRFILRWSWWLFSLRESDLLIPRRVSYPSRFQEESLRWQVRNLNVLCSVNDHLTRLSRRRRISLPNLN